MRVTGFEMIAQFTNDDGATLRLHSGDHIEVITDETDYPKIITGTVKAIATDGSIDFESIDDDETEHDMPFPCIDLNFVKEIKIS